MLLNAGYKYIHCLMYMNYTRSYFWYAFIRILYLSHFIYVLYFPILGGGGGGGWINQIKSNQIKYFKMVYLIVLFVKFENVYNIKYSELFQSYYSICLLIRHPVSVIRQHAANNILYTVNTQDIFPLSSVTWWSGANKYGKPLNESYWCKFLFGINPAAV